MCFFHLAWAGTSGPARADYAVQLNNVKLACDYIKLCAEVGCKRVVYASSINEMGTMSTSSRMISNLPVVIFMVQANWLLI